MDDPKFDGVRDDVRLMGSWLSMLIAADMAYPTPAYIPPPVPKSAIRRLVEAGLVDLLDGHRFRIHGLDAEREKRRALATTRGPSGTRPVTVRYPDGDQAEAEQSRDEAKAQAPRDPADIYWSLTGKYPTDKVLSWVDDLTAKYGPEATIRAVVKAHTEDRATSTLLGRAQDVLRAGARELDRQERTHEQARLAEKRAIPRAEEPWRIEYRAAIERQYREGAA
jgi:hypothetical protein